MVAFTPTYELPYQEGTDPPCFGPGNGCDNLTSVWCDFVAIVEEQFDLIDAIAGRTASAIPMARILFEDSSGVTVNSLFPFDTVAFDTDNMVDLNTLRGITINRNGVYRIDFHAKLQFATNNSLPQTPIVIGFPENVTAAAVLRGSVATAINRSDFSTTQIRSSTLYAFDSTVPNPRTITVDNAFGDITGEVLYASLAAYWHSEVA